MLNIAGVLFYTNVQDEFKKLLKAMPIFLAKGEEGALIRGIANPALQYVETEAVEVGGKVIGRIGIQAVEGQLETQFADAVLIDMQMAA